jgi:flavin reductase (DIM6/NTAB) family NADH-FMN oxidoreductase RutF
MFYETASNQHGLAHDPLKAIVAPRPIGWISAVSQTGQINLSPYSFFNMLNTRPALLCFSSEGMKDAMSFVAESGEFVCNLATYDLRDAMNASSAPLPRGESEFIHAGLEMAESRLVKAPRVKAAAAALECKLVGIQQLKTYDGQELETSMAIGQVIGVHIDERCIRDGRFDMTLARTIARCGYADYAVVDEVFSIIRPPGAG